MQIHSQDDLDQQRIEQESLWCSAVGIDIKKIHQVGEESECVYDVDAGSPKNHAQVSHRTTHRYTTHHQITLEQIPEIRA